MKILYAIQATGNGHISRAREIIPHLEKRGDLDILLSGNQANVSLPYDIKYRMRGLSFVFGKHGGVGIWDTLLNTDTGRLLREIRTFPAENYDLIINDFEPVTSWACKRKGLPCISLSHQAAVLHPNAPQPPSSDPIGLLVLKHYAPTTDQYGFHFRNYADKIFTPVIRRGVRQMEPKTKVTTPFTCPPMVIKPSSTFCQGSGM
jgi:uncharacterized protein (TIGR00661 family)